MLGFSLLAFGIFVGVVSGLLGLGGGILLIPGLVLLFGFSQAEAQGTSLAVMIPPIGIFAAAVYYQHGFIRLPVVGFVAIGFMLGAYFGARLLPYVPLTLLRTAFGVLLLYLGFTFVLRTGDSRTVVALPAALATIVSALIGRVYRRRVIAKRTLPPPAGDLEYHI